MSPVPGEATCPQKAHNGTRRGKENKAWLVVYTSSSSGCNWVDKGFLKLSAGQGEEMCQRYH